MTAEDVDFELKVGKFYTYSDENDSTLKKCELTEIINNKVCVVYVFTFEKDPYYVATRDLTGILPKLL